MAYLTVRGVKWADLVRGDRGRLEFVFDLDEPAAMRYRIDFTDSPERVYAQARDLVMRVVQEVRRNH